nr:PREDICTED: uncharacterized protein LOC102347453 [Latimeria chalumnae]|eukprot:XP_014347668.1 PREDICTED: uncharacterized protein LOC102347453 [Latimeria chalumnae]
MTVLLSMDSCSNESFKEQAAKTQSGMFDIFLSEEHIHLQMSVEDKELDQWLTTRHARVQAVHKKLGLLMPPKPKSPLLPRFGNSNQTLNEGGYSPPPNPVQSYLVGKSLQKEIEKHYGLFAPEALKQNFMELLRTDTKPSAAVSSPKQRMIDDILARRSIQRFKKEEQDHEINTKLEVEKARLVKELKKLQLQKKHLRTELIVSPQQHDDVSNLQSRILQTMENLPDLEDKVKKLREELYKEAEKRLEPNFRVSLLEGAEPYQIRDIQMVRLLLDEVVEELMDDYVRRVPEGLDSYTAEYPSTLY